MPTIRRIVTGRDPGGRSVFASDQSLEAPMSSLFPGLAMWSVWGADEAPRLPTDGTEPNRSAFFPPATGWRCNMVVFPPAMNDEPPPTIADPEAELAHVERSFPGLLAHMEPDTPGMHTTESVDIGVVVSGEIWLELDDGVERLVKQGDIVVQNGTRHRWVNKTNEPATIAFVLIGAPVS